jgi:hypothetical protein
VRPISDTGWPGSRHVQAGPAAAGPSCANERGAILVLFALVLTLIIGLGSIVISVGNWYVHKRHLQTQVDAAAFAAGTLFSGCFADPVAADGAIRREALRYAGDLSREPATTNLQVQEPQDVHAVLNSSEYWTEGDATDDATLRVTHDNTIVAPGDATPPPGDPSDPCETRFLDVKATDSRVPDIWPWLTFRPSPKTHARVEIRKVKALSGILPFAVPEVDPGAVAVLLTDEDAPAGNEVIAKTEISHNPNPAGTDLDRFNVYDGLVMGVEITNRDNLSLIVLVSRTDIEDPDLSGNSLATICSRPGVRCYAGAGKQDGLALIHGYESGSASLPALHRVDLGGCGGGVNISAPYFVRVGDCVVSVTAEIEFGTIPSLQVRLHRNGTCSGSHTTMTNAGGDFWTAATTLPDSSTFTGPVSFSIAWRSGGGSFTCFPGGTVARPYVANGKSGPVEYLSIDDVYADGNATPLPNPYSIPKEATMQPFSFMVTVGLRPPLEQSTLADEPVLIRFATENDPSLTQSIDCDVDSYTYPPPYDAMPKDSAEIAHGCVTPYAENETLDCSDYSFGDLPPDPISALEDAPDCAQSKNGNVSSLRQGISARFENPCTPNFWPDAPITQEKIDELVENFDTDPRLVTLFVTEFGAFAGTGSTIVPIKYFAGFYVTGWDYSHQTLGCPDNDPHPLYGTAYQTSKPQLDDGDLWGYFVTPVVPAARASDELCAFDELRTCIAVLVE